MSLRLAAMLLALVAAVAAEAAPKRQAAEPPPCRTQIFEDSRFTVCTYRRDRHELRLAREGADGQSLGGFRALAGFLGSDARRVAFAMNAGMYEVGGRPLGLYVADGETRRALNTREASGNFYLKPNGVFSVDKDGRAHVDTTEAWLDAERRPAWATQSGPMLLIDGELHPKIDRDGPSRLYRNGVGVAKGDVAWFVISDDPVSLGRLARFFRDRLHATDALFLDGSVSSLWAPSLKRTDGRDDLGPMVVVLDKRSQARPH